MDKGKDNWSPESLIELAAATYSEGQTYERSTAYFGFCAGAEWAVESMACTREQFVQIMLKRFENLRSVMNRDINTFPLSVRVANVFEREGITCLRDFAEKSKREIYFMKDFGAKSIDEIASLTKELGVYEEVFSRKV